MAIRIAFDDVILCSSAYCVSKQTAFGGSEMEMISLKGPLSCSPGIVRSVKTGLWKNVFKRNKMVEDIPPSPEVLEKESNSCFIFELQRSGKMTVEDGILVFLRLNGNPEGLHFGSKCRQICS